MKFTRSELSLLPFMNYDMPISLFLFLLLYVQFLQVNSVPTKFLLFKNILKCSNKNILHSKTWINLWISVDVLKYLP